jgi:pilus assembly protein CpaB
MRGLPTWSWLLLAVAMGLGATFLAMGWFQEAPSPPQAKQAPVVVAAHNLEPGAGLDGPVLRVEKREARPEGGFAQKEELMHFEAAASIKEGAPVLRTDIRPRSQGLAARVHPGKRAMTVKVDDVTSLAGLPGPGNRVDVVLATRQGEGGEKSRAETVLQNLPILSYGANIEKKPGEKPQAVTTITLEVTPGEAERLALAVQEGHISLVLRNQQDQGKAASTGVNLSQLLGARALGAPAKAGPVSRSDAPRRMVEIIRKTQVEQKPAGPQRPGGGAEAGG